MIKILVYEQLLYVNSACDSAINMRKIGEALYEQSKTIVTTLLYARIQTQVSSTERV